MSSNYGPEDFGGSDEGSHYMAQERIYLPIKKRKLGWHIEERTGSMLINDRLLPMLDKSFLIYYRQVERQKYLLRDPCQELGIDYDTVLWHIQFDSYRSGADILNLLTVVADDLRHEEEHGWSANIFWRWRHGIKQNPTSAMWSHPNRRGGFPCLRGTNHTVSEVLRDLADGFNVDEVADNFDFNEDMLTELLYELALVYERRER